VGCDEQGNEHSSSIKDSLFMIRMITGYSRMTQFPTGSNIYHDSIVYLRKYIVTCHLVMRQVISGFWIYYSDLLVVPSGGIYNYFLQSQSTVNTTAFILLHRLTSCILVCSLCQFIVFIFACFCRY
jgi:hypothetical protein